MPNSESDTVDVIDQRTGRVIDHFATGALPQHVTPSWDLRTLWVTNDMGNSLTPIDPRTGAPAGRVPVADPYNLYFTADGRRAIVVAEAHRELDFREPHTMRLRHALHVPRCAGVDHMDFTADGRLALVSCEFAGRMIVVDLRRERVVRTIALRRGAMPQDVKLSPDGRTFYVADMASNGVWLIDARRWRVIRFQPTGRGAHGLYPSRDARHLYVSNRGEGTITVLSFRTPAAVAQVADPRRRLARTWAASPPTAACCGSAAATTARSTRSPRAPAGSCTASRSAAARTACASGRSPAATRSGTPASCAEHPFRLLQQAHASGDHEHREHDGRDRLRGHQELHAR